VLRSELIKPRLEVQGKTVKPARLPADYHYLQVANDLIALLNAHIGLSRGDWAEALRAYEGDSLDYQIIRGLASVLENRATFGNEPAIDPTELRQSLFQHGPILHKGDLFHQTTRPQAIAEVAQQYQLTSAQVEMTFFADLKEEQTLLEVGEPLAPGDLIARYNLEVARGLLYWAKEVEITVHDTYKDVFKYIKLFKLMHTVQTLSGQTGYQIILHGPISPFVTSTIRYGLQFAKFLPALLLCEQWHMKAQVRPPGSRHLLRYTLDEQTDLRGHFKRSGLFDSKLEADFAAEFEAKYSGAKRKWILTREDELIVVGDTVMIPDFSCTHRKDGRRALIEIIGFWHPTYLRRKLAKIQQAQRTDLILLVYESANVTEESFRDAGAGDVLFFARKPVLKEVLAAVERCAVLPDSKK